MCRSGINGRRCPGQDNPVYREVRNAKRRASYVQKKSSSSISGLTSSSQETASTKDFLAPLNLPVTTGVEMEAFEFKSRLSSIYNPDTFTAIKNGSFGSNGYREKPSGGLWSSPIERDEDMEISEYDSFFQINQGTSDSVNHDVRFTPEAKVLIVDSRADYDALLSDCSVDVVVEDLTKRAVDYERLSRDFDAVYFTTNAVYANGRSNPADEYFKKNVSLRNLDIASLLIMNPKSVKVSPGE
jgi:hypothetical protein